jgi:hypothetical protein
MQCSEGTNSMKHLSRNKSRRFRGGGGRKVGHPSPLWYSEPATLYPQRNSLVFISVRHWLPGLLNAYRRNRSLQIFKDPTGNRIRNLPSCGAVPQPTVPPPQPSDENLYMTWQTLQVSRQVFYISNPGHSVDIPAIDLFFPYSSQHPQSTVSTV